MTGSSSRSCVRSVSFPTRSHPSTLKVDEQLNKSKNSASTENALLCLAELYNCVDDFIRLPLTQKVLIHHREEKFVEALLDESVSLLDVCSKARDVLLTMKEGIQDLQSSLRRKRGEEWSMKNQASVYISLRKSINKDVTKCLGVLEKLAEKNNVSMILDGDHHLSVVVRVLREVNSIAISIFQRLLSFLTVEGLKRKVVGWSLVSKVIQNKRILSDIKLGDINEVKSVDLAIHALCRCNSSSGAEVAQTRLKALEVSIECLEDGVECMYRRLIRSRVSLLNSLNH